MKELNDFMIMPKKIFTNNESAKKLLNYYSNDVIKLLTNVFPDYNFNFNAIKVTSKENFTKYENQQKFMVKLYEKLELNSLDDWIKISRKKIIKNGGKNLLNYYSNDIKKLFISIFPNYFFDFEKFYLNNFTKGKNFFQSVENQRKFFDHLFKKYQLKSIDDFLFFSNKKIIKNGGKKLLKNYSNDKKQILISIYPNYSFDFEKFELRMKEKIYFKLIENQLKFMDDLFIKLRLKSIGDWKKISKKIIIKNGGKILLKKYKNNYQKLLISIYPNYFNENNINNKLNDNLIDNFKLKNYFQSIENQRKFMNYLYEKLNLKSMDDWMKISSKILINNGGKKLLKNYLYDKKKLLILIFPNYPFDFEKINLKKYFKLIENQRKFMDDLFDEFQLKSIDDWKKISKKMIIQKGGNKLLKNYLNDKKNLLISIYPNYSFDFNYNKKKNLKKNLNNNNLINNFKVKNYFRSIINQRKFVEYLYKKYELKSLDEFLLFPKKIIIKNGGKKLLNFYLNDKKKLLNSIFPNYSFDFEKIEFKLKEIKLKRKNFHLITYQRLFMDKVFEKLDLKTIDDWLNFDEEIYKKIFKKILKYYSNDYKKLLTTIYPNYLFNFEKFPLKINSKEYFEISIKNQQNFMEKIYKKYQLKSLDEFLFISNRKIVQNGGNNLLKIYLNNYNKLLTTIFPNFSFDLLNLSSKEFHLKFLNYLFEKLNLKSIDDWLNVPRNKFILLGAKNLLDFYSNDLIFLLSSLYPSFSLNKNYLNNINNNNENNNINNLKNNRDNREYIKMKFRPNNKYYKTIEFNQQKIKYLINKYKICQKKDWYRLPLQIEEINIFRSLSLLFPNEKWDKNLFLHRAKKSNQRQLYIIINQLYKYLLILEDYRPPNLIYQNNWIVMEFDIFIPSLNLAMEYQGRQHFDDIPDAFGSNEMFANRDRIKEKLAEEIGVKLISVPYWSPLSSSLLSSLISHSFSSSYN